VAAVLVDPVERPRGQGHQAKEIMVGLLLAEVMVQVVAVEQAQLELELLHQLLRAVPVAPGSFLLLQEARFNMLVGVGVEDITYFH
jgi:hypothetical protein